MSKENPQKILLAHGGGGQLTDELIRKTILPRFKNDALAELADSADVEIPSGKLLFTTDSYVIKPLFFSGGDIGKLAICGTINDLAVAGAKPIALSLSLIIEEGLAFDVLEKILDSAAKEVEKSGVEIVAGDTKTVEAGAADGLFINTSGIGEKIDGADLGFKNIKTGDEVVLSGTIGDHGLTIMSQREGIELGSKLESDCAAIADLTCELLEKCDGIKFMRDPTRGGLAATLNEIAAATSLSIEIRQAYIPVKPAVQAAADMLGLDILTVANEGKFVAVVSPDAAKICVDICRAHPLGKDAAVIGRITDTKNNPLVELKTIVGGSRIVQMPYGRQLPRIC